MSYVTGSHAFKGGMQLGKGGNRHQREINGDIDLYQEYRTTNGVRTPASVVVYNTPQWAEENIKYDLGMYIQDSFTYKSLTLNPGLRFEAVQHRSPGAGIPGRALRARAALRQDREFAELARRRASFRRRLRRLSTTARPR